jgi:hypothetical protein
VLTSLFNISYFFFFFFFVIVRFKIILKGPNTTPSLPTDEDKKRYFQGTVWLHDTSQVCSW